MHIEEGFNLFHPLDLFSRKFSKALSHPFGNRPELASQIQQDVSACILAQPTRRNRYNISSPNSRIGHDNLFVLWGLVFKQYSEIFVIRTVGEFINYCGPFDPVNIRLGEFAVTFCSYVVTDYEDFS